MASKYDRLRQYENLDGVTVAVPEGSQSGLSLVIVAVFVAMMLGFLPFIPPMAVLAGIAIVWHAFRERTEREWIQDTPVEDVESLSLGPSAVLGRAVAAEGDAPTAPFTDEPYLAARWKVTEDSGKDDRTLVSGTDAVPFSVDDGTGRVLVRPDPDRTRLLFGSGDFENDSPGLLYRLALIGNPISERIGVASADATPDRIREFCSERGIDVPDRDVEYSQQLIRPGEDVYVFGLVQRRDGVRSASNERSLVIQPAPADRRDQEPAFVVSTVSRERLVARRWWFWLQVGVGGALLGAGLLFGTLFGLAILAEAGVPF